MLHSLVPYFQTKLAKAYRKLFLITFAHQTLS